MRSGCSGYRVVYNISMRLIQLKVYKKGWYFGSGDHGDFQNYHWLQVVQPGNANGDYKLGINWASHVTEYVYVTTTLAMISRKK